MNPAVEQALKNISRQVTSDIRRDSLARSLQYGGQFTSSGLEQADKDSELNALDRIMIKNQLGLGLGGTVI